MDIIARNTDQCLKGADGFSVLDDTDFRMTVWEENGVLHVYFCEPVALVTKEADLEAEHFYPGQRYQKDVLEVTERFNKGYYDEMEFVNRLTEIISLSKPLAT